MLKNTIKASIWNNSIVRVDEGLGFSFINLKQSSLLKAKYIAMDDFVEVLKVLQRHFSFSRKILRKIEILSMYGILQYMLWSVSQNGC